MYDQPRKRVRFDESGQALVVIKSILQRLSGKKDYQHFENPVDPEILKIPEYFDIIKNPMDLGTVQNRIKDNYYNNDVNACVADIALVWDNCFLFNHPDSEVAKAAAKLQSSFAKKIEEFPELFSAEQIGVLREPSREKYHLDLMSKSKAGRRNRPSAAASSHSASNPSSSSSSSSSSPLSSFSSSTSANPSAQDTGIVTAESDRAGAFSSGQIQEMYYEQNRQRWREQWRKDGGSGGGGGGRGGVEKGGEEGEGGFSGVSHIRELFPLEAPSLDRLLPRFEGDERPLTGEEKDVLFEIIVELSPSDASTLIDVLRRIAPQNAEEIGGDIVEFDIDKFDVRVQRYLLWHLVNWKERCEFEKKKGRDGEKREEKEREIKKKEMVLEGFFFEENDLKKEEKSNFNRKEG